MKTIRLENINREDVIGLDIQHGHIVASHFRRERNKLILGQLAIGEYDENASEKQLALAIRALWKKEKLPTRTVNTCLHSHSLLIRYFHYENLTEDELPQALALEAEEALQYPANQISIDWQLDPRTGAKKPGTTQLSGTLIAAPRNIVEKHLNLIQSAGLYSIRVETSCSALSNLYSVFVKNEAIIPVCLINLSERSADIIMSSKDGSYPRTLFSTDSLWEHNIDYLLENIQNSLLYYHIKLKNPPIEKIILAGRIPSAGDLLKKRLEQETRLPIEVLDIYDNPRLPCAQNLQNQRPQHSLNVATGIGLGLQKDDYELV